MRAILEVMEWQNKYGSNVKGEIFIKVLKIHTHKFVHIGPDRIVTRALVVFNRFCSRTPRYDFSSTLYTLSCWCIIQVMHSL
jgi:hypothetical protein